MDKESVIRRHLVELLRGGGAHATPETILGGLPAKARGSRPGESLHTPWELLEHLRLAQWDILEFSRNPKHRSPPWPEGYWPEKAAPSGPRAWKQSVDAFLSDLRTMIEWVSDPSSDLHTPFPHGDGQNLFREALLTADHNAYHLGQMVQVRHLLGCWPPG